MHIGLHPASVKSFGKSMSVNLDANAFRAVMRQLASSVAVITARDGSLMNGLTATAVCSVSADPPTILACVNQSASAAELILKSRRFAINILAEGQEDIARLFSTSKLAPSERFSSASWSELMTGAPILDGAVVNIDCELADCIGRDTHYIFIGRIQAARSSHAPVLVYRDGEYRRLALPAS